MKDNQCKYLKKCRLVKEFCKHIKKCEKKIDKRLQIKSKSGKSPCKKYVFKSYQKDDSFYVHFYTKRPTTAINIEFGKKETIKNQLWKETPPDFKEDCYRYMMALKAQDPDFNPYCNRKNIFYKALSKHRKPITTLKKLSDTLGNTLSEWIKKGYLAEVHISQPFTAKIIPN